MVIPFKFIRNINMKHLGTQDCWWGRDCKSKMIFCIPTNVFLPGMLVGDRIFIYLPRGEQNGTVQQADMAEKSDLNTFSVKSLAYRKEITSHMEFGQTSGLKPIILCKYYGNSANRNILIRCYPRDLAFILADKCTDLQEMSA